MSRFYDLFDDIENSTDFDVNNELDMSILKHFFISIINESLEQWRQAYIYHTLRTEKKTPLELFESRSMANVSKFK